MTVPEPWCPRCERFAADMTELDDTIADGPDAPPVTPDERADYVRQEEGTYNPTNGHFLCDRCYIDAGMPSAPGGWRCP